MTRRWADFQAEQPRFADAVRERFAGFRHHVLGTLRTAGSPRLTGLEADFRDEDGELWPGMMPGSLKALDLRRDPRFALHANTGPGADSESGDVRVSGRAVEVTDPEALARCPTGAPEGVPDQLHLFRAELTEAVGVRVDASVEQLVFEVWHPGRPLRTVRRGNDDGPTA